MKTNKAFVAALAMLATTGAWAEETQPEKALDEMQITGAAIEEGYVAPNASTGTKTDTPIMETPMNIQVIPEQVLEEQKALTLDKALTNVSGVISNSFGQGQETLYVRGFQTFTTFLNGFKIEDNTSGQRTLTNLSSIEVLKGPAAILYGDIEPGGLINLVTKQPKATPEYSIEQSVGTWDHYITNINATGPINEDKTLLYQVNLSYETKHSWIDGVFDRKIFFAPTIQFNVTPTTQITLEMQYTHNPFVFSNAQLLPIVNGNFIKVPRSTRIGATLPYTVDTDFLQARVAHEFNDDWTIKFQVGDHRADAEGFVTGTYPAFAQIGNNYLVTSNYSSINPGLVKDTGASLDLIGHFEFAGIKNKLLAGVDYYHSNNVSAGAGTDNSNISVTLFNPVYAANPVIDPNDPTYYTYRWESSAIEKALYVQDQAEFPHHVFATAGFRYDHFENSSSNSFAGASNPVSRSSVTPRLGVLWKPINWLSLYGNYAENLSNNVNTLSYLNQILEPSGAKQYEGGIKAESPEGDLRASLAYFDLTKTNVPVQDPDPAHQLLFPGAQILLGETESKGTELDIEGNLTPSWKVIFAYAHTNVKITKSNPDTCGSGTGWVYCAGYRLANIPTDMASLWTTYEFKQELLQGWKIGGGITASDSSTSQDNQLTYPGFAILNAMIEYGTKTHLGKLTGQVNFNNILDKYYYTGNYGVGGFGFASVNIGEPSNVMASIKLEF